MAKREHPRYENTEWEDYEFREYPMMVYVDRRTKKVLKVPTDHPNWDPGNPKSKRWVEDEVTVNSDEELKALRATVEGGGELSTVTAGGATRMTNPEDARQALIAEAEVLGVQVDKRWGADKLQAAIDAFKEETNQAVV